VSSIIISKDSLSPIMQVVLVMSFVHNVSTDFDVTVMFLLSYLTDYII